MAFVHRKGEAIQQGCRPRQAKAATTPQTNLATMAIIMHLPAGTMATSTRPHAMAATMIPLPSCHAIGISETMNPLVNDFFWLK